MAPGDAGRGTEGPPQGFQSGGLLLIRCLPRILVDNPVLGRFPRSVSLKSACGLVCYPF